MAKVEFELNLSGLNELMKSPEMQSALDEAGAAVAHRVHTASFVSIANVYPDSKEAAKENYETNSLLKAIGSVGLSMSK